MTGSDRALVSRRAGRVFLVDADERVLLVRGSDPGRPDAGTWWITPGGGVEEGESFADAARRELAEETGQVAVGDLGEPVHHRTAEFDFEGVRYRQVEEYFLVRATSTAVDTSGWTDGEVRTMSDWRWWPLDELAVTDEAVYPQSIVEIIRRALSA